MKRVLVTFFLQDDAGATVEFTSENDSLHIRSDQGVIEVRDGNIVRGAYANIPVVVRNMDGVPED